MYKISDIAKYIINEGLKESQRDGTLVSQITNLRLQMILYICQVIYFKTTNKLLFSEKFVATSIGPRNEEVYNTYCGFGSIPISIALNMSQDLRVEDKLILDPVILHCIQLCKDDFWTFYKHESLAELETCKKIYNKYGQVEIPFTYIIEIDGDRIYEKYRRIEKS